MRLLRRVVVALLAIDLLALVGALCVRLSVRAYGDSRSHVFSVVSALDGIEFRSEADGLRRARCIAVLGGLKVDLTGARAADGAELSVLAVMGAVELFVPASWNVLIERRVAVGDVLEVATPAVDAPGPRVRVVVTAVLGGVAVKTVVTGRDREGAPPLRRR